MSALDDRIVAYLTRQGPTRSSILSKALEVTPDTLSKRVKGLIAEDRIRAQGATRSRTYYVPGHAQPAVGTPEASEAARIAAVVARAQASDQARVHDSTVRTRRATPEELARCSTPAPSAAAPSAPATPATTSTEPPCTSGRGGASAPAPVSPSDPLADAARRDMLEAQHMQGAHVGAFDSQCPRCRTEPLERGPDLPDPTHRPVAPAEPVSAGAAPAAAAVVREINARAILGHAQRATLDDATLAREQIRARYALKLIDLLAADTPEHIFDRIESLTA